MGGKILNGSSGRSQNRTEQYHAFEFTIVTYSWTIYNQTYCFYQMSIHSIRSLCNKAIFSGIQPTGIPHLGNYFGAIAQWLTLTKVCGSSDSLGTSQDVILKKPIFSIVDVHAYCSGHDNYGEKLYSSILSTTASLVALGLDLRKCILFRQSDVLEHYYMANVLQNFISIGRLTHMTQFKDKSNDEKRTNNSGLLYYPVLQAADILLYKTNIVPVGNDQLQHIELTRDIARTFNDVINDEFFPIPEAYLNPSTHAQRIRSLRDPSKKMSKSDKDLKSFVQVVDEPDVILEKCKKAITDCISSVYYEPDSRPGVSNLMTIYHLITGQSFEEITEEFANLTTAQFKLKLADALIGKFEPARLEYEKLIRDRPYLEKLLEDGATEATIIANKTVRDVKYHLGSCRSH